MTPTEAVDEMLTNSNYFFKWYPVRMFGGAPGPFVSNAENLRPYRLSRELGRSLPNNQVDKFGHQGATRPIKNLRLLGSVSVSTFHMKPDGNPLGGQASPAVATCCVPMVNYNSDIYNGINLGGVLNPMAYYEATANADYLTTGQLSGCCFTWCTAGPNLRCTHVLPEGNLPSGVKITGAQLQTQIAANGRFHGMPGQALQTYGFNDYGVQRASVIGVRTVGAWRLFAQVSGDMFKTISEVWQLHPGPAVQIR